MQVEPLPLIEVKELSFQKAHKAFLLAQKQAKQKAAALASQQLEQKPTQLNN